MVAGHIRDTSRYIFDESFEKAFKFLKNFVLNPLPVGRYEIESDRVYAMVQEYEPNSAGRFESHKKYADIQFIAQGGEEIGWCDIRFGEVSENHSPEKDIAFYKDPDNYTKIRLFAGDFAVFFPEDLHRPSCYAGFDRVIKVVVKIKI